MVRHWYYCVCVKGHLFISAAFYEMKDILCCDFEHIRKFIIPLSFKGQHSTWHGSPATTPLPPFSFKIRNIELQVSPDVTLSDAFLWVGVRYQNTFPAVMTSIKEDSRVGFGSVQFGLCLEQLWPESVLTWDISNGWYMLNRSPGTA